MNPPHRGHQATWGGFYSRNGQTCSSLTGRTSGLPHQLPGAANTPSGGRARASAGNEVTGAHQQKTGKGVPAGGARAVIEPTREAAASPRCRRAITVKRVLL